MQNGQATGPESIDSLAEFLVDNSDDETTDDELLQNSEESLEDNSDESPDEEDPADDEGEDPDSEEAEKQTSLKFKVPVKGEDGTDTTIEVDEKELVAGYQRHADYTRKTQELANKEREVTQVVATRLQQGQAHYMQQAQIAHAAVTQLAGLKSPEEMAMLAQTDPAQWVQEQQRERAIHGVLDQLQQGLNHEQAQLQSVQKQHQQQAFQHAWGVLGNEGIDKPKLQKIYATVSEKYGIAPQQLNNLYDPKIVMIMRDAALYQDLKDKRAVVTKKAAEAPRLPAQRQSVPKQEQRNKALSSKFSTGKAKLGDLAAWIANN